MSGTWRPFSSGPGPGGSDDPRRVGESLETVTRSMGGADPGVLGVVFAHWEEAVGAAIADHATPVSLRDAVLVVAVPESAWATQLRFLEGQILERLQEAAGRVVATRIEVRVRPSQRGRRGASGRAG